MGDIVEQLREAAEKVERLEEKLAYCEMVGNTGMAWEDNNRLRAQVERLEAERDWWHEQAWEIASEHEFHNGGSVLNRDTWETQQAAIREADDE